MRTTLKNETQLTAEHADTHPAQGATPIARPLNHEEILSLVAALLTSLVLSLNFWA